MTNKYIIISRIIIHHNVTELWIQGEKNIRRLCFLLRIKGLRYAAYFSILWCGYLYSVFVKYVKLATRNMAVYVERCRSLKEALFEALAAVLSNEHDIRAAGEEQMKILEVTEGSFTVGHNFVQCWRPTFWGKQLRTRLAKNAARVAYSVELVLLNKHQIWGGAPKLGCYREYKSREVAQRQVLDLARESPCFIFDMRFSSGLAM